ncbi:D-alanyl-D-alanine carboxypeptidase [Streptomyces sp. NPDC085614]|uniref:D-alanyl-D-alanine carboxypeptidase n=1 Tax=Streptomyces sp. NPDC085614 TaxID=3365733 RepID=UPI0037D1EDC3
MTHGGGTVAGESPDKAEQKESSQGAAPGGGARDPRLSVLREAEGSSTTAKAPAAVRVDQPTAVFRSPAPRVSEDDAPAAEKTAEADSETAPETEAETETEADVPAADADSEATAATEDEAPAGDESAGEAAPEDNGDRLRAAVAAWVASGDDPRTEERPEGAEGTADASADAAEAEADAEAEAEAEAEADADASADEVDEPEAEKADAVDAEPAADADADADASADEPAEPEAEKADTAADSEKAASAAAEPAAEPASEVADSAEDGPAAKPASAPESWFASRKPAPVPAEAQEEPSDAAAPAAESDEPDTDPDASDAETATAPDADAGPDRTGAPAKPVDQPTAVFKTVRPAPVDQPTTALKLPPTPAPAPDAPKPAAERPSTFVPLRKDLPEAPAEDAAAPAAPRVQVPAPAPVPPASLAEAERTRQQPMPPLPPLDLLAELTNTPPPPQTPLRTTVRRVRIWTPLVVLLLIVFAIVQFVRPLPPPVLGLTAEPTFTFEGGELQMPWPTEGQGAAEVEGVGSLGTYGAQKPAPIASVAKTMTAYVILRDHPIKGSQSGPEIPVDKKAGEQAKAPNESTAPIKEGQEYSEKELLQLLMIPSGNNVARLLARWDAGSEAAFVEKMNAAAKDLGMTDSVYTDPSGLQSTTVSTPLDQLKLAKAVMQNDVFREIVNMPNLTVEGIPGQIENNNNILLKPGVGGIKTGSSTPAGGNLLWSANTVVDGKNRRILGVVMGAKDADQLYQKLQLAIDYSLKIIEKAQADVTSAAVVRKGQVVGHIDDGLGGTTPVVATKELKAIGWPGLKVQLRLTDGGKAVPHTAKAGDVVGEISIGTGAGAVSAPVALQKDLVEPGFDRKLTRLG